MERVWWNRVRKELMINFLINLVTRDLRRTVFLTNYGVPADFLRAMFSTASCFVSVGDPD